MVRNVWVMVGLAALAGAAAAGQFGLGLGVTVFTPPVEGASLTPLFDATAHYGFTKHWVGALSVGYARYSVAGTSYSYVPVIPRAIYHIWPGHAADPFVGAGFVYSRQWWSGAESGSKNTYGYSGLTGVNFTFSEHFGFGLGVEYVVPDAGDFDSSYPSFMLSLGAGAM